MDVVQLAREYREREDKVGKGGVVIIYKGKAGGWVDKLRNPERQEPGCIAVDEEGRSWTATGGTAMRGALMWLPNDPIAEEGEE